MADLNTPLSNDNDLTLADVLASDEDVEDSALARTDTDRMRVALRSMWSSLTPLEQCLIELFYFDNLDGQQIADMLHLTRQTVHSHLTHALGRLRGAHELAQTLRKGDGFAGRIADPHPKTKQKAA